MINLHNFDTVQTIGWVILGLSATNYFLPYKDEKTKYMMGMVISGLALVIFTLNIIFNIGE